MTSVSTRRTAAVFLAAFGLAATLPSAACRRRAEAPGPLAARAPTHPAPARSEAAGYSLLPSEKEAVDVFLAENRDLRVATDDDRRPDDANDLRDLYGVYHPYFVRGDSNNDGILDFLIAFVRRDSDPEAPEFTVVSFPGRAGGAFEPGSPVERGISLADGDVSIDRDAIVVTPDTAEDATRRYRWDPARRRHVFVRDEPDEPESPPPART